VSRFSIALGIYGLLGLVAWLTLPDQKVRGVTLAVLAMFAVKSWLHHRRMALERNEKKVPSSEDGVPSTEQKNRARRSAV
jgi:hypothetical protein